MCVAKSGDSKCRDIWHCTFCLGRLSLSDALLLLSVPIEPDLFPRTALSQPVTKTG